MRKCDIVILMLCLTGMAGCGAREVGSISGEEAAKAETAPAAAPEVKAEQRDPAKFERDRAQATKLLEDGHVLAPRVVENFEVIRTNDRMSIEDGRRAFEFRKTAFRHCYREALAYNLDLKGSLRMSVKYAGSGQASVEHFEMSMQADGLEACFRDAASKWLLPEGAEVEFKIDYSTRAAPTPEEIRKVNDTHGNHDHDHDHEHEGAGHEGEGVVQPQGVGDVQN
ncbi:MAG: hypothetical protein IJ165_03775 [Proteobacteria bacterium]|nr:hypothetical protein [Pseudomonadota bacterium]